MRHMILTAAAVLIAGPTLASSIEIVKTPDVPNNSVTTISCADCPPLKPKEKRLSYIVPELKTGTQRTVAIDVDGEKKLVRTEAWMGGSPVVFVHKAAGWTSGANGLAVAIADGSVDRNATTAAVDDASGAEPAMASMMGRTPPMHAGPDVGGFDLRLK
ncbi:plant virulence effector HPE1-like domain-containing protein [Agrobacterium sp. ES01]|uniref:plant virulence effector HPE1-like domain-containing protein n=1 Tax=Agrobacterium sp. ES01 TaxID=3420714 RepID=UPI003D0C4759